MMESSRHNSKISSKQDVRLHILSTNSAQPAPMAALKRLLDENRIQYQIITDVLSTALKDVFEQKTHKHMVLVDNTEGIEPDMPAKNTLIEVYSYPKKHFSKKYSCLPKATKVLSVYNSIASLKKDSVSRVKLRSVCRSPEVKQNPVYIKLFVQESKEETPPMYVNLQNYLLELPGVSTFNSWKDLTVDSDKLTKKTKFFAVTYIEEGEQLIKTVSNNKISEYVDFGIVGVKPTKELMKNNMVIATENVIALIDFISERGFDLSSIRSKLMRHMSFVTQSQSQQTSSYIQENCPALSVIPQKRQTLCEQSNIDSFRESEMEKKLPQPSKWHKGKAQQNSAFNKDKPTHSEALLDKSSLPQIQQNNKGRRSSKTQKDINISSFSRSVKQNATLKNVTTKSDQSLVDDSANEILFDSANLGKRDFEKLQQQINKDEIDLLNVQNLIGNNKTIEQLLPIPRLKLNQMCIVRHMQNQEIMSWNVAYENQEFVTKKVGILCGSNDRIKNKILRLSQSIASPRRDNNSQIRLEADLVNISKQIEIIVHPPINTEVQIISEDQNLFKTFGNDTKNNFTSNKQIREPIGSKTSLQNSNKFSQQIIQKQSSESEQHQYKQRKKSEKIKHLLNLRNCPQSTIHQVSEEYHLSARDSVNTESHGVHQGTGTSKKYLKLGDRRNCNSFISGAISVNLSYLARGSNYQVFPNSEVQIVVPRASTDNIVSQKSIYNSKASIPISHNSETSKNYDPQVYLDKMTQRVVRKCKNQSLQNLEGLRESKKSLSNICSEVQKQQKAVYPAPTPIGGFRRKSSALNLQEVPQVTAIRTVDCIVSQKQQKRQAKNSKLKQSVLTGKGKKFATEQMIESEREEKQKQPSFKSPPGLSSESFTSQAGTIKNAAKRVSIKMQEEDVYQLSRPSRILKKSKINLQNYDRTITSNGVIIYRSKQKTLTSNHRLSSSSLRREQPDQVKEQQEKQNTSTIDHNTYYKSNLNRKSLAEANHIPEKPTPVRKAGSVYLSKVSPVELVSTQKKQHSQWKNQRFSVQTTVKQKQEPQVRRSGSKIFQRQIAGEQIVRQLTTESPNYKVRQVYSPYHRRISRNEQIVATPIRSNGNKKSFIGNSNEISTNKDMKRSSFYTHS